MASHLRTFPFAYTIELGNLHFYLQLYVSKLQQEYKMLNLLFHRVAPSDVLLAYGYPIEMSECDPKTTSPGYHPARRMYTCSIKLNSAKLSSVDLV